MCFPDCEVTYFCKSRNIFYIDCRISMDVRKLVVKKFNEGWSQRKIAKELSISRRAEQNILLKLRLKTCRRPVAQR